MSCLKDGWFINVENFLESYKETYKGSFGVSKNIRKSKLINNNFWAITKKGEVLGYSYSLISRILDWNTEIKTENNGSRR